PPTRRSRPSSSRRSPPRSSGIPFAQPPVVVAVEPEAPEVAGVVLPEPPVAPEVAAEVGAVEPPVVPPVPVVAPVVGDDPAACTTNVPFMNTCTSHWNL